MDFIPESFTLRAKIFVKRYAAACILCLFIIIFALSDTSLVSLRHIRNVFSDAAPLLLAAAGMGLCLFSGYIDLSAGSAAVFASVLAASFMQASDAAGRMFPLLPPLPVFLVVPFVGVLFFAVGMLNGFLIKKIALPAWFTTFGTGVLLSSLTRVYLYDKDISLRTLEGFTRGYNFFGTGYFGFSPVYSIPFTLIFSIVVFVLMGIAVNIFVKELCVPVFHREIKLFWPVSPTILSLKETMLLYGIASALFALSGMMISARAGAASVSVFSAADFQVEVTAICFIASFSLFGGRGNRTALAASVLIFSAFGYASDFVGINRFLSSGLCALILLVSAAADIQMRKKNAL
ncbi:MAG: ABC transporter permease [Treponema sp.]|uniref:ABC transporter permease n=1 Tax=Treponema sp. TaxID=166 RepID=UPI003FA33D78